MRAAARLLAIATLALSAAACKASTTSPTAHVRTITLSPATLQLLAGQSQTVTAAVTADPGADTALNWTSSAPLIASVDQGGKVTAHSGGTANIVATSKSDPTVSATAVVSVGIAMTTTRGAQ